MQIHLRRAEPIWDLDPPASADVSESDQPIAKQGERRSARGSFFKAAALFLLVTVVSLSTLAKTSRSLPQSNPSRYLSHVSKMRVTSGQRLSDRRALNRNSAASHQSVAEVGVLPFLSCDQPLPNLSAGLNAHQLRSPPVNFS